MRKMGKMEALVRAKSTHLEGISLMRASGQPYGTIRASGNPDQQTLISEYEILRGDLSRVLFDLTAGNENIEYVFGEEVASLTQTGDGGQGDERVMVEFANGRRGCRAQRVHSAALP